MDPESRRDMEGEGQGGGGELVAIGGWWALLPLVDGEHSLPLLVLGTCHHWWC
jgi:hypothetical protein